MRLPHRAREPLALKLAGRVGSLVDLEQVGRKSGTVRHTPVRAFRRGETVVIGANFGSQAQWVRNVLAAGGCRMRMRGRWFRLTGPRLVSLVEAEHLFPRWFAWALRRVVRTEHCLVMTVAD